jgi:hypothetical protein
MKSNRMISKGLHNPASTSSKEEGISKEEVLALEAT